MESRKELIELIREQAEIEKVSVEKPAETERKVGTGAARLLLVEMRLAETRNDSGGSP